MADPTVRVTGLTEANRALKLIGEGVDRQIAAELKVVGDLVRSTAASKFAEYDPRSAAGYRVRVRQNGVVVEQSLRRVTGYRSDYGALQMTRALIPALEEREREVVEGIDQVIGTLISRSGL